jgi:hypothetical protein
MQDHQLSRHMKLARRLIKSVVATSLAVVKCAIPAFGLGTLAGTCVPLSIVTRKALL